ncbi:autotransporter outer membrane beta-barrel domain-containing protein [Escherichia coli]|nr:autotransporter outer membrane beta-barrel domain-containing protein [Escherichia coli]
MTLNVNNSTIGQSSDKKINITTNGQDSNRTDTLNLNVKDSNVFADIYAKNYGTANVTLGSGSALVGDATAESETNGLNIALNDGATWDGDFTNKSKNSNKSTVSLAGNSHWTGDLKNSLTILDDKSNNSLSANAEVTLASGSRWDGDIVSDATNANTSVNINGSVWSGNVNTAKVGATDTSSLPDATATVSLSNGAVWLGGIATGATDTKTIATNVNLDDSLWVAGTVVNSGDVRTLTAGNLTAGNVSATNSTIDLTNGSTLNISSLTSKNSTLSVADKNKAQLNLSAATGDITLSRAGTLTNDVDTTHKYITLKKADNNNLSVLGTTESGAYQYDAKESKDESGNSFWTFARTDRASNASSVIQAMAAAPANVANLQADTLSARQDAVRLSENDEGGVWIQYFGGKQKHTTAGNASYDLDVNGVMLGGDTRFMTEDGSWLAGVAMSSAKGDMTTMQSKGDTEGYSFHAYLSRQYNNGIFIDTAAQFGHYSNTADVRLMNGGGTFKADFNTNGFGAMVKGGYTWEDGNGLFIQPYAKLSALTLEGVDYQLNGVDVHSDSYNSVLGEAGTRVGYDFAVGNATVKPYLNLAALNEFSDGNKVRLGDESVNASIDGAAFRVGAGVQADITKNMGAYASLDYTKGDDIENPLQGVVGVNVTW